MTMMKYKDFMLRETDGNW